jgi:hypothetical protein
MKSSTPIAHVAFGFEHLDPSDLCKFADGTVTGLTANTYITVVPVVIGPVGTTGTIQFLTAALRSLLATLAAGNTSTTLTKQIGLAASALMAALTSNGHSVQDQANALAAGNLTKAETIISSTGYKLAKARAPKANDFSAVSKAVGQLYAHSPKAKKGSETHNWRFGITTAKGVIPTVLRTISDPQATIVITDLPEGSIVAIQHSSVTSGTRAKKTGGATTTPTLATGKATPVAISKTGSHPSYSWNTLDPYHWTDFIYVVIK